VTVEAPPVAGGLALGAWRRHLPSLAAPIAFVLILAMVIVPLPPFALDVLFTFNICFGLMILLASLYTTKPTDFSAFPTLLLVTTLLRLSLNVAAARVILLDGYLGSEAAGHVIESFGAFVVGGNYAVGIAVFAILVIINFVVITKGSGRIAEVAARFVLDGMPGKQMAIDADLNAGLINQEEAMRRRQEVAHEADFFGAMDGASKFVRGDAVAAILILFINLIGGLVIAVWQHGLSLAEAGETYTLLTIGDGLVAQIPALVISAAAGVIVSRVSTGHDVGNQLVAQLSAFPKVWWLTGGIVGLFGLVPGMPHLPFLFFALVLGGTGWWIYRERSRVQQQKPAPAVKPTEPEEIDIGVVELVEPLEVEVGYRLVGLVSKDRDGGLLRRLRAVRKQVSREFGFLVPVVHVRDNADLRSTGYRIMVYGVERAAGEVHPDKLLAIPADKTLGEIHGIPTRDPVFGRPAQWIMPAMAEQARAAGYTVFDAAVVIATHFERVIKDNIETLFGRAELDGVLAFLGKQLPKLVEELTPKLLPLTVVHKVLCGLLVEHVPIRDLRTIVVTLIEEAGNQDPKALLETVRIKLRGFIVQNVFGAVDELKVMALESDLEKLLQEVLRLASGTGTFGIEPALAGELRGLAAAAAARLELVAPVAALAVRPELRELMAQLLRPVRPRIRVFSYQEIPAEKRIKVVELLGRQQAKVVNG